MHIGHRWTRTGVALPGLLEMLAPKPTGSDLEELMCVTGGWGGVRWGGVGWGRGMWLSQRPGARRV